MNILGNSGIESGPGGLWPGASYPSIREANSAEAVESLPIGQQMHRAQTMIHYLSSVVLPDLYGQLPLDAEHIQTVKALRSDYRLDNKKLKDKLTKQKKNQDQTWVRPRWTLAG